GHPVDDVSPPIPKFECCVTELCARLVGEHDSRCGGGACPTGLEPDPALLGLLQEPQLDLFDGAGDIERCVSWEPDRPGLEGALVDRARRVQQLGGGEGRTDELTGPYTMAGGRVTDTGWWPHLDPGGVQQRPLSLDPHGGNPGDSGGRCDPGNFAGPQDTFDPADVQPVPHVELVERHRALLPPAAPETHVGGVRVGGGGAGDDRDTLQVGGHLVAFEP